MSTGTWSTVGSSARPVASAWASPIALARALGSLKITVTLFSLGIAIVLIGTLAQDEETLVQVKREYFNSWIAWIPLDVFLPQTWYEHATFGGGFPLPGGAAIGLGLMINLIAAKATRFSIQAKGGRLLLGWIVTLLGAVLVTAVILSGHAADGLQGQPPISYDQLWFGLKIGMIVLTLAAAWYAVWAQNLPKLAKWVVWSLVALMAIVTMGLMLGGDAVKIGDPGLRIVWQLMQATIASSVILVGMVLLFAKRGGNMLIHVGVALLMVGQFMFGDRQIEQRLTLVEGDRSNMVYRTDELEIAVIDVSGQDEDHVLAIPEALIRQAAQGDGIIDAPELPCMIKLERWMPSSALQPVSAADQNLATQGVGLTQKAIPVQASGGAKSEVNLASAYVTLMDRNSRKPLGTVLLSQFINDAQQVFRGATDSHESIDIDGKRFELALRFRREYKDYMVELKDVIRENYSASETPRDFSSLLRIHNEKTGEEITEKTWMNNPIRFRGETFYQSDYFPAMLADGRMGEGSGLQVVRNSGWMIPYVCCMMVMVGMVYHFSGTFLRFANRVAREQKANSVDLPTRRSRLWVLAGIAIAALFVGYGLKGTRTGRAEVDWAAAAKLPVQHEGRIKPADTVAANVLQSISEPVFGGLSYVKDAKGEKHPRVHWLLAVMADAPWVRDVQVFRVYAKEVRDLLKLEERDGFRYSFNEIDAQRSAFFEQIDKLREKSQRREELDFREQKISEFYQKLTSYELLSAAYDQPAMPEIKDADNDEGFRNVMAQLDQLDRRYKIIESMHPPAFIPPLVKTDSTAAQDTSDPTWLAYGPARFRAILDAVRNAPENSAVSAFEQLMLAVRKQDASEINAAVRRYERLVAESPLAQSHLTKTSLESWLNGFNPTAIGIMLYLLAFVLGLCSMATKGPSARNLTYGILLGVFVIHTLTLLARMYISGRAPVTNLYSSAVFIGWACVLFCLILERIHRLGVANLVAAMIGVITMAVARSLDKGDTMHVLAAVLDTQFWLSTHVVIITAGYAVTYLAGFFGAVALAHSMWTGRKPQDADSRQRGQQLHTQMYRMAYFSVCFGILFSFVGTVLGGLWADDSWGRFWGWDPKENGALMIVLWNAVVLHARWDKLVGVRGFSILALIGNIITSWSWFGTNLLGIGLHEYGFNKSVAVALVITVTVHLLFIALALFMTSSRQQAVSE
jgi:ABC-type transport system involved in cytochrome c biogenesis permease subunit